MASKSSSYMTPEQQAAAMKYLYGDQGDAPSSTTSTISGNAKTPFSPTNITQLDANQTLSATGAISSSAAIQTFDVASLNRDTSVPTAFPWANDGNVEIDPSAAGLPWLNAVEGTTQQVLQTFMPNVLDNYSQITYNFKLAMAPESQLLDTASTPTGPFYIVAQSGVSANFYIKSVNIESVVGPNAKTRNVMSTIFNMTIVEPQGISLMDKLLAAGKSLSIKNFYTCPMILELTFRGYEKNGRPSEVNIAKKTWRIQLNDIQTKMDQGGSEYNLSFIIIADFAFNRFSSAAIIPQQLTFPVDTVGQFFDDLGYFLTLRSTRIADQGQIVRSEYEFNIDPSMRSWKIGEVSETKNAPSMFIDQDDKRNIVLNTNMTLDRIVDVVLATTKEGNLMVNPASDPEKMDQQPTSGNISKIAQINSNVSYLGFNTVANDYIKKYSYYIHKYDSYRALIDKPDQTNESARVQYMLQDAMKKKYEYIFTGENTDVLNLDINLNNLWRHATMYYANSLQRKTNISSKFIKQTTQPTNENDLCKDEMSKQWAFTPNPNSSPDTTQSVLLPGGLSQNYTPIPNPNQTYTPTPTTLPSLTTSASSANISTLDTLSNTSVTDQATLRTAIQAQDASNTVIPVEGMGESISNTLPWLGNGFRLDPTVQGQLIETLSSSDNFSNAIGGAEDPILGMFIKQVDSSIDTLRTGQNLEDTTDTGRSIFGIITNQLYDNTVFTNLLKVDLEVRGDPFWLGESDVEILNRLNSNTVDQPGSGQAANYLKGENCFFLTFNTPQNYNENTGFVEVKKSELYMGVYSVVKVRHVFEGGKFTQHLEAIRDIQTSAKTLQQYIR